MDQCTGYRFHLSCELLKRLYSWNAHICSQTILYCVLIQSNCIIKCNNHRRTELTPHWMDDWCYGGRARMWYCSITTVTYPLMDVCDKCFTPLTPPRTYVVFIKSFMGNHCSRPFQSGLVLFTPCLSGILRFCDSTI